ncbi:MAG: TatD family hydrolase [Thermotogota bacterium]
MRYIDTHSHTYLKRFDEDRESLLEEISKNLDYIIDIGIDRDSITKVLENVKKYDFIYGTVGFHPTDTENFTEDDLAFMEKNLEEEKIVAIGEIGLDFHWDTDKNKQFKALGMQMELAKKYNKPIVFHIRDAYDEAYDYIKKIGLPDAGGVVHCFSSDWKDAKKYLDLGLYLGVDGPLTYPKNDDLRQVVKKTPLDKILPETDSPFLPPVPFRGKRNDPLKVKYVYEEITKVKEIYDERIASQLKSNSNKLFNISK